MRPDLTIKTRSLGGTSDLTLLAPIKVGLVPSLETVTYKTRIQRLLKTLNTGRSLSHEYALFRPFSDAVERVGKIHSVRVSVFEPEDQVLLSVTFDGAWESYIRVLWQKVGALLDVIFCNTENYVSARDHTFEEWAAWAHRVQRQTAFFYGTPEFTVDDIKYLRSEESLHCARPGNADADLKATQLTVHSAENSALGAILSSNLSPIETARQGYQSLASLYRLTDLYLPTGPDGKYLHRAARELLAEFSKLIRLAPLVTKGPAQERFAKQIKWFTQEESPSRRSTPVLAAKQAYDGDDVQGGILEAYPSIEQGRLLLMSFENQIGAAALLEVLAPLVTTDRAAKGLPAGALVVNVAFTCEGLRALGLAEAQINWFPQEFREGMEARASVLGDLRTNHPRRWRLPERNGVPQPAGGDPIRVELSAVHLVVQLRAGPDNTAGNTVEKRLEEMESRLRVPGASVLSRQLMCRHLKPDAPGKGKVWEHFGFVDGDSQPSIYKSKDAAAYENQVHLGDLLLGYANQADEAPTPSQSDPTDVRERFDFLRNGSFLVIRKLRQDVEALRSAVKAAATTTLLDEELVYAKMMGRSRAGIPLSAPGATDNDFTYQDDAQGLKCPFQAHIRRVNPRQTPDRDDPLGARFPRLMRRSMSYGPRYVPPGDGKTNSDTVAANNNEERGLIFMAYNASISEQFEVMQRWISGGNSTGVFSGQNDPFMGVAENGKKRHMRFAHVAANENDAKVFSIALDGSDTLLDKTQPEPFIRLEWGAYLFTPSIRAIWMLKSIAASSPSIATPPWSAADGMQLIEKLQMIESGQGADDAVTAWKVALEDPVSQETFASASIWAAIRKYHQGALRTPYGVLVADRDLVMGVFMDAGKRYTVSGYQGRLKDSIGEIYLGLDKAAAGCPYDQKSTVPNRALMSVKEGEAFELARNIANNRLGEFIAGSQKLPTPINPHRWELTLDIKELLDKVLADICEKWFGISEAGGHLKRGGSRWDWPVDQNDPPLYPGNFTAPSRYTFQPNPSKTVKDFGQEYGRTLTQAVREFINEHAAKKTLPTQSIFGDAIFGKLDDPSKFDQISKTLVGALMGFLPTVDGNIRLSLNEWLREGTIWSLRAKFSSLGKPCTFEEAQQLIYLPLVRAMQLRPSPELAWRTATQRHMVGPVSVLPDDKIVVAIVSATQQCLELGIPDIFAIFGGNRKPNAGGPHPTHACPAYNAAMGVIQGVLVALLETKETMRASAAPLAFTFEGRVP